MVSRVGRLQVVMPWVCTERVPAEREGPKREGRERIEEEKMVGGERRRRGRAGAIKLPWDFLFRSNPANPRLDAALGLCTPSSPPPHAPIVLDLEHLGG